VLAHTGMRRGIAGAAVAGRGPGLGHRQRPPLGGMVRVAGESAEVTEGGAKSGKPPVIDLDAAMVAVLPHTGRRAARSSSPQARRPRSGCTIYGTPTRRSC